MPHPILSGNVRKRTVKRGDVSHFILFYALFNMPCMHLKPSCSAYQSLRYPSLRHAANIKPRLALTATLHVFDSH